MVQSPYAVILEPKNIKYATVSIFSPSICHEVTVLVAMILVFWMLGLSQLFHSLISPSSRGSLVTLHFLPLGWCHLHSWGCWYFSQQFFFTLIGGYLLYNIVVVFAIQWYESAMGVHVSPHPKPPIPSLWVVPVHWLWVLCFINHTWTGDLFHIW